MPDKPVSSDFFFQNPLSKASMDLAQSAFTTSMQQIPAYISATQAALEASSSFIHPSFKPWLHSQLRQFSSSFANNNMPAFQAPSIDVFEDRDAFEVQADMPGVSEDSVEISYQDGVLNIRARSEQEIEDIESEDNRQRQTFIKERRSTIYQRAVPLGVEIDEQNITAGVSNGTLHITLPKAKEDQKPATKDSAYGAKSNKKEAA